MTTTTQTVKAQIKTVIDSLGMKYPTMSIDLYRNKTIIKQKALRGGSIGPMTCTNAHINHMITPQTELIHAFATLSHVINSCSVQESYIDNRVKNYHYEIQLDSKTVRTITFKWQLLSTYSYLADLDSSYKTYWLVMDFTDSKISK